LHCDGVETRKIAVGSRCRILGALLIERFNADGTLAALFATTLVNMLLAMALFSLLQRRRVMNSS
jgi:hypothetical protein